MDAAILCAIAEAATPAGRVLGSPDQSLAGPVLDIVRGQLGEGAALVYGGLLRALDLAGIPLGGRLSTLPLAARTVALERLADSALTWPLVRAVTAPIKAARVRTSGLPTALGVLPPALPTAREPRRWHERIVDAATLDSDLELEVDAVIVGSGAGGAPVARALAAAGHAVVILEEGAFFTRESFDGDAFSAMWRMYRDRGATVALGNAFLPVPMGRTVGGSTTVNSGTCYRVPASVQRRWAHEEGLSTLGPGSLDPYYERVEAMLRVAQATPETLGGCAAVIARGAEALGLAHGPLLRNAPDCDGRGLCCFGCPTDAKRSTNVSYLPAALERGAQLFSRARVERILVDGDRATGVVARALTDDGPGRRLTIRAGAVVLAAGSLGTPELLLREGLANTSGRVGRGLTIHPATHAFGVFDESIRGFAAIPQGYAIEELAEQGVRFEGVFVPPDMGAATMPAVGRRWTELVEAYEHIACFGFMVTDTARGRVVLDPRGKARMLYSLHDADRRRMLRAHALLARVFLAAGAREVMPGLRWSGPLRTTDDVRHFEREAPTRVAARHMDVSAFHPLGSCRMGDDPRRSVVSPSGETHDVRHLFVCDGSAVPGPLGVNPQMTIMALSERASALVSRRAEEAAARGGARSRHASPEEAAARGGARNHPLPFDITDDSDGPETGPTGAEPERRLAFAEVMAGSLIWSERPGEPTLVWSDRREEPTPVEVRVRGELALPVRVRGGALDLAVTGTIDVPPLAREVRCEGRLEIRPLRLRRTLRYELRFDVDGPWRLVGEKHVGLWHPIRGVTTLHVHLLAPGDRVVATGVMRFDLRDAPAWLSSFCVTQT